MSLKKTGDVIKHTFVSHKGAVERNSYQNATIKLCGELVRKRLLPHLTVKVKMNEWLIIWLR